jgi:hypothetical protein
MIIKNVNVEELKYIIHSYEMTHNMIYINVGVSSISILDRIFIEVCGHCHKNTVTTVMRRLL